MQANHHLTRAQADQAHAPGQAAQGNAAGPLQRLLDLAEKHAQPAHDEEAYYNPPHRSNPWEGIGYFWFALTAGVAGWACSYLFGG